MIRVCRRHFSLFCFRHNCSRHKQCQRLQITAEAHGRSSGSDNKNIGSSKFSKMGSIYCFRQDAKVFRNPTMFLGSIDSIAIVNQHRSSTGCFGGTVTGARDRFSKSASTSSSNLEFPCAFPSLTSSRASPSNHTHKHKLGCWCELLKAVWWKVVLPSLTGVP